MHPCFTVQNLSVVVSSANANFDIQELQQWLAAHFGQLYVKDAKVFIAYPSGGAT
jgi:hypothetical protein